MMDYQLRRRQALVELLALPDTPDLRRAHHLTVEGRPNRHEVIAELAAAFIQRHKVEQEEHVA
jgi:hypothetical protein